MAKGSKKSENATSKSKTEDAVALTDDAKPGSGVPSCEPFETLAAECLNHLSPGGKTKFSLRFMSKVDLSNYSRALTLADKHQSSMMCPWSSSFSGAVTLEQEFAGNKGDMLALNSIAYEVSNDDNMMTMCFRVKPLPLGEIAIPRCSLFGRTRSGPKSADLDPSNFLHALRSVSFHRLLESCQADTSEFNTIAVLKPIFKLGELRSRMEDQNVEYKYPEGTWNFGKFVQKSFNKYLIPLLNGATDRDVELWLGVDKHGRNVGGAAAIDELELSLRNATLDCFPPIMKQDITIEIYPLEVPSPKGDRVVQWFKTAEEAQKRILELEGRGWQVGEEGFGVVSEKQEGMVGSTPAPDTVLRTIRFERVICCVKARSVFREAYINQHVRIGSLLPFDIWLRARKNIAQSFLDGLRSSSNIAFQLGGTSVAVEGIHRYTSQSPIEELRSTLLRNPKKSRFVVVAMRELDRLVDLIRKNAEEHSQSVHFDKRWATWKVAPVLGFGANMAALCTVKNMLGAFPHVRIVEVLCEGFSHRRLQETKPGEFAKFDSFEVVGVKLPQCELENYKEDAEQFLFPDRPRNDTCWACVEYYVVPTAMVRQIVDLVDEANHNQASNKHQVIHVVADMMYSGLTCTLKKAAMLCAERFPGAKFAVLFLRGDNDEADFKDLETYLASAKQSGRKCIIFQDSHHPSPRYDDALGRVLSTYDSCCCCLVKGSRNLQYNVEPDVFISSVWDVEDIRGLRDVFSKVLDLGIAEQLDRVVQDAERDGCYPFFVLPLVARHGEYIPIKRRMEDQARLFEDNDLSGIADCLAFVSATCDESRVQKYLAFSCTLNGEDINRNNLLKTMDQGTRLFVHPEAGRVYIWVTLENRLPSKDDERFPLSKISSFVDRVITCIFHFVRPRKAQVGLLQEIFFERGTGRFSPFSSFVLQHPTLFDEIYTSDFVNRLARVVPECDVLILMARMNKHLKRYDEALQYATRAIHVVGGISSPDYRKVLSNFAGVSFARYDAERDIRDYDQCHITLLKLIECENDPNKQQSLGRRLEKLNTL